MFTNLDAIWLVELSQTFRGEPEEARLRLIAEHIQNLDDCSKSYADGVRDERLRIFGRANIPPTSKEISGEELAAALARFPARAVKRAGGVRSGGQSPASDLLKEIKLDLSSLGL